jgi:DNA-binding response OmpR family regulator
MSSQTVLLIEDASDDILTMGRAFSRAGVDAGLSVVRDGEEAVSYLRRATGEDSVRREPLPSLILLDLNLPKKSGLEVLSWIRGQASLKRVPVVVLTSAWNDADVDRAYELGANSYLVKPVGFGQLVETVRALKQYWLDLNRNSGPRRGG